MPASMPARKLRSLRLTHLLLTISSIWRLAFLVEGHVGDAPRAGVAAAF